MAESMILIVASGVLTTLLGVGFGCLVLELAVRALRHKLIEQPPKGVSIHRASSQWLVAARK
ncbi:MAG: hypothetical protein AABN33_21295 [Acidobacteriota bacterium]